MTDWGNQPPQGPPPQQPPYQPPQQPPYQQYGGPPPGYSAQPPAGGWPTFSLASWGKRVVAGLLDGVIGIGILAVGGVVLGLCAIPGSDALIAIGFVIFGLFYFGVLGFGIWNQIFLQGRTGQSLGKKKIGIKVVSESNAQPIGALNMFLRYLCHYVDSFACYLGWLWPLWDQKRQTFADKLLHTVVIEVPKQ